MNPVLRQLLAILFIRLLPGVLFLAAGVQILLGAAGVMQMLLGFLFFLLAAIILAPLVAGLLSAPFGNLFWPRRTYDRPQPIYSIPRARRLKGLPEEALLDYEQIAAEHPSEVLPWIEMIDIAISDLHDFDRANQLYRRGIAALHDPDGRDQLAQAYAALRDRTPPAPGRVIPAASPRDANGPAEAGPSVRG